MKDIIIVGAGPTGSRLAMLLSKEHDVLLIEEHEKIGEPVQCAGLVSPRCIDDITEKSVLNKISEFVLHSPSGRQLVLRSKEPKGVVIDRMAYDSLLAEAARQNGAEILLKTRAIKIDSSGESVKILVKSANSSSDFAGELVAGCDGPKSIVRKSMTDEPFELLYYGAQAAGKLKDDAKSDAVEMFLGNDIAPGFFAWKIPAGENVRIGLCSIKEGSPVNLLTTFIQSHFPKFEVQSKQAGIIPLGNLGMLSKDRTVLLGDAACQTKPLTGGGIYLGKMAAEMLAESIKAEGHTVASGELYERMFKTEFGRELLRAWRLRRILNEMSDQKIEKAIDVISDPKILSILENAGDIDYPANLSVAILRKAPHLLQFFPELVKSGF